MEFNNSGINGGLEEHPHPTLLNNKRSALSRERIQNVKRNCVVEEPDEMEIEDESPISTVANGFVSAKSQYITDQQKKFGKSYNPSNDKYKSV